MSHNMAGEVERRKVLYCGRVQGVGFRYTVREAARGYAVTGFVRNLRDGRVELVAEGTAGELDGLLRKVAEAMSGNIEKADVEKSAASGEFSSFEIAP